MWCGRGAHCGGAGLGRDTFTRAREASRMLGDRMTGRPDPSDTRVSSSERGRGCEERVLVLVVTCSLEMTGTRMKQRDTRMTIQRSWRPS